MTTSLDVYPSTFDYEHGEDPVLVLVENALERYLKGGTSLTYISGELVCAVGSVWAADGISENRLYAYDHPGDFYRATEHIMSTTAKTAMALLDQTTVELYPETAGFKDSYFGPLEFLNQNSVKFGEWGERKAKVLQVYNLVIERLRAKDEEFSTNPISDLEPVVA